MSHQPTNSGSGKAFVAHLHAAPELFDDERFARISDNYALTCLDMFDVSELLDRYVMHFTAVKNSRHAILFTPRQDDATEHVPVVQRLER